MAITELSRQETALYQAGGGMIGGLDAGDDRDSGVWSKWELRREQPALGQAEGETTGIGGQAESGSQRPMYPETKMCSDDMSDGPKSPLLFQGLPSHAHPIYI